MCHLLKAKASFAFRGHFKRGVCNDHTKGPVCGHNGVSYRSECEAWSEFALVDYPGECREVGLVTSSLGARCTSVKCAHLPFDICSGIVPPGACCPICGTGVRIVYSRKQIDRALYALGGKNMDVLTLRSVLQALAELIQVSQCHLSGYLTFETDIFISVEPLDKAPTFLQIEACAREADKIATLIATQSHRVTSDLRLSALTVATIVKDVTASSGAAAPQTLSMLSYLGLTLALIRFTHKIWR
jgi:reversion-inducing-cysteine-rich protein with kazal motifs